MLKISDECLSDFNRLLLLISVLRSSLKFFKHFLAIYNSSTFNFIDPKPAIS